MCTKIRYRFLFALLIADVLPWYLTVGYSQEVPKEGLASITAKEMYAHVAFSLSPLRAKNCFYTDLDTTSKTLYFR